MATDPQALAAKPIRRAGMKFVCVAPRGYTVRVDNLGSSGAGIFASNLDGHILMWRNGVWVQVARPICAEGVNGE